MKPNVAATSPDIALPEATPVAPPASKALAMAAFAIVGVAWGTTYGAIRVAVETIPPFTMAGIRFTFGGVVMLIVFRAMGRKFPTWWDWKRIILTGVMLLSLSNGLLAWAEQYLDSSYAALMVNIVPFLLVGLSALTGEKVPRLAWIGLLIGFLGVGALMIPKWKANLSSDILASSEQIWALIAMIVGPTFWALGTFHANRRPPKCGPFMMAASQTIAGGIGAFIISGLMGEYSKFNFATISAHSWMAMAWLITVGSWLGYVAYMYCVIHLPTHRTASIIYVNIVVAMLVGVLVLGEPLTRSMIIGGITICLGVYLVNLGKTKK